MVFWFRLSIGRGRHQLHWPRPNDDGVPTTHIRTDTAQSQRIALPQTQCRLFHLPTEIRLYIYQLTVLIDEEPLVLTDLPTKHLAVLQTCRRILYEAETIFYEMHRFQSSSLLFHIGPTRQAAITALTIVTSSGGAAHHTITELHLFPKLKSLYIQREMSIRYLNVSEWSVMAKQMQTELAKLPSLVEVKVLTPIASNLTPAEEARREKLARVDALLERDSRIDVL